MRIFLNRTGQTWSLDILVAAGVFVLAFILFFYVISLEAETDGFADLKDEGEIVPSRLITQGPQGNQTLAIVVDSKVDTRRLSEIANKSYDSLKRELGIKGDFCIYFEDEDGNLVNISEITGKDAAGIGSPNATISGLRCGY
ncbi:MAG: hypothetical protein ABH879_03335 [archaeon]